jgi:peptide/nickel transport system substrate-binding protein
MGERPTRAPAGRPISRRRIISLLGVSLGGLFSLCACRPMSPSGAATSAPIAATAAPAMTAPATIAPVMSAPATIAPPSVGSSVGPAQAETLRLLFWQAPTILNPHLGRGIPDAAAARCCFEPLLTADDDGRLIPVLAAEVPSSENGGLPDERTVIYRLRAGVVWADGHPFTADDVVFTYQFIANPQTAATTGQAYQLVERVEALDALTVRVTFKEPTAGWYVPFVGRQGMILPRHTLQANVGADTRSAPFNQRPFGTGPYVVDEFKPGDLVTYSANARYRDAGRPSFRRLLLKGGGDPITATRTVLQTGEYDFAPFLQVESDVLEDLAVSATTGQLLVAPGGGVEMIVFNQADPAQEVDGERSHPSTRHPFLADIQVREALALAVDRTIIAQRIIGRLGEVTANVLTTPRPLASANTRVEYDVDRANQVLDEAGYARGSDGIRRTPTDTRMQLLFSSTASAQRQKVQAVVKDGWQKIGVETEIRAVDPATFLASADNPGAAVRFPADAQMFLVPFSSPFPSAYMRRYYAGDGSRNWTQKSNNWTGTNIHKWREPEYDRLYEQVLVERDLERSRLLWQRLNDVLVGSHTVIPVTSRNFVTATAQGLVGPSPRTFDSETWNIAEWRR